MGLIGASCMGEAAGAIRTRCANARRAEPSKHCAYRRADIWSFGVVVTGS